MDGGSGFWARAPARVASPGSGTRCRRPAPADPPPSLCLRRPTARRAPPLPGSLPGAPWDGRSRRWAERMRPGWSRRAPWLQGREESPKETGAATSARTELLCGRQPHAEEEGARGGPAPAPAGPPPSRQAPPHSLPQPAQGGTKTAPPRPALAAPPLERGLGGGNRHHPDRGHAPSAAWRATLMQTPRAEGAEAGLRACVRLRAPPTRPSSRFSN